MNTIIRRTALAVPVTLPSLSVSALATPADPAVEAYRAPARLATGGIRMFWNRRINRAPVLQEKIRFPVALQKYALEHS